MEGRQDNLGDKLKTWEKSLLFQFEGWPIRFGFRGTLLCVSSSLPLGRVPSALNTWMSFIGSPGWTTDGKTPVAHESGLSWATC